MAAKKCSDPFNPPRRTGCARRRSGRKRGCAPCAHFGLRTGAYCGRIESDWRCFRDVPVFARPGTRFESHLGHDVFPRQRRICFDVCTKLDSRRSDGLVRGLWPGRRGGLFRCVGGGSRALAGGRSACCSWVSCVTSFRFCRACLGGLHLFMGRASGDDMTSAISIYNLLARDLSDVGERCGPPLSSQRRCFRGHLDRILWHLVFRARGFHRRLATVLHGQVSPHARG
jgi:hypothetical protein